MKLTRSLKHVLIAIAAGTAMHLAQAAPKLHPHHQAKAVFHTASRIAGGTGLRAHPWWVHDTKIASHVVRSYPWEAHIPLNNQIKVVDEQHDHDAFVGVHSLAVGTSLSVGGASDRCASASERRSESADKSKRCGD